MDNNLVENLEVPKRRGWPKGKPRGPRRRPHVINGLNANSPESEHSKDTEPSKDTEEDIWRRGLLARVDEALQNATYETDWKKFRVSSELVVAAKHVSIAWERLSAFL